MLGMLIMYQKNVHDIYKRRRMITKRDKENKKIDENQERNKVN